MPQSSINRSDSGAPQAAESTSFPPNSIISLFKELITLNYESTPATAQVVGLHQALGRAAMGMTRNKHKMYLILARSREICNDVLAALESPPDSNNWEFQPEIVLQDLDKFYTLIDTLEEVLLEVADVMPSELEALGPTSPSSWPQSRAALTKIWTRLEGAPFDALPLQPLTSFTESSYFDDCAWFSRLFHEVIEHEIARQFPEGEKTPSNLTSVIEGFTLLENAIKCLFSTEEVLRGIAIDMASALSKMLWETAPSAGEKVGAHSGKKPRSEGENLDWLLTALSGILSELNRDSPLALYDVSGALSKWLDVRSSAPYTIPLPPIVPDSAESGIQESNLPLKEPSQPPQSFRHQLQKTVVKKISRLLPRPRSKASTSSSLKTSTSFKSRRSTGEPLESPRSPKGSRPRGPGLFSIDELQEGLVSTTGKRSAALEALDCTGRLSERTGAKSSDGHSEVSQAKLDNHVVAVKALRARPDESRMRKHLAREIYVWAALDHPYVLKLLGFTFEGERPCLVSPWCGNGPLPEYLSRYPDANRRELVRQIAQGLEYLHNQTTPIIHGDFKTANILVTDDHVAKICDFGGSRHAAEAKTGLTTAASEFEDIRYTAPEIIQGSELCSLKSDVYSFACVTLETMTGKCPFWKITKSVQVIPKVLHERQTPSAEDHPGLEDTATWDLLRRCWNYEPSARPKMSDICKTLVGAGDRPSTTLIVPEGTTQA